jgi:hypothetical protein
VLLLLSVVVGVFGCHPTDPEEPISVPNRFLLQAPQDPDGLLPDSSGSFFQFVAIDFLSARTFLFQVCLIPDAEEARDLSPEDLLAYPHMAIPYFPLSDTTYRDWLDAVVSGIRDAGARSL